MDYLPEIEEIEEMVGTVVPYSPPDNVHVPVSVQDVNGYMMCGDAEGPGVTRDVVSDTIDQVCETAVVLTVWGGKWLKHAWGMYRDGGKAGVDARALLAQLEEVTEDPIDLIEDHSYINQHKVCAVIKGKAVVEKDEVKIVVKKKLKKGGRSKFACAVAKVAYNKFGERPMSEANMLVTRKWLAKYLEDPMYKDLRTCDKNIAIDRALFLSFVPTKEFQEMKMMVMSRPWEARNRANNVYGGFWDKVCYIARLPQGETCDR